MIIFISVFRWCLISCLLLCPFHYGHAEDFAAWNPHCAYFLAAQASENLSAELDYKLRNIVPSREQVARDAGVKEKHLNDVWETAKYERALGPTPMKPKNGWDRAALDWQPPRPFMTYDYPGSQNQSTSLYEISEPATNNLRRVTQRCETSRLPDGQSVLRWTTFSYEGKSTTPKSSDVVLCF